MIKSIAQIDLDGCVLKLRRAWPRAIDHLLVEYVADDGRLVPGQWLADKNKLRSIYKQTQATCSNGLCTITCVNDIELLLQPSGADRKLVGLPYLIADDNATLISHRPERRAVVKLENNNVLRYAKVMRPERIDKAVAVVNYINSAPSRLFDVPQVLGSNNNSGVVILSQVKGRSLFDLLYGEVDLKVVKAIGKALRNLHNLKPIDNVPIHDKEAEIEVVKRWINLAESFNCDIASDVKEAAPDVYASLSGGSSDHVLIHRDFYDKQIIVDQDQGIGILDFDTLAVGEAALDLANVLVHFELRAQQGNCFTNWAEDASTALLAGYDPTPGITNRLGAYKNAARLRLACVYSFRPNSHNLCMNHLKTISENC